MGQGVDIPQFGKKLELLFRSNRSALKKQRDLTRVLIGVTSDYFSRMKGGSRPLSEPVFQQIITLTADSGLVAADWYDTLEKFGGKLGLSSHQTQLISGTNASGIDFNCRNKDTSNLSSVFGMIGGYWESFYYSVSTYGKQQISHDLVFIGEPDDRGFMPCRVLDGSFTYTGHCFPLHSSFVYFMLEKDAVSDEIIVYLMNRPERPLDPLLDGIILCTSGGVEDKVAVPCAARVAFRYLGKDIVQIRKVLPSLKLNRNEQLEAALIRSLVGYLNPDNIESTNKRYAEAKAVIDNTIKPKQVPFALRMERQNHN